MNVNVSLIRIVDAVRYLKVVVCTNVPPQFPADLAEKIILSQMPTELSTIDYNIVLATIKDAKHSYATSVIDTTTGYEMYVGFSTYSMYAAIGAAALREFEDNDAVDNQ
jgi:hypothetical protein